MIYKIMFISIVLGLLLLLIPLIDFKNETLNNLVSELPMLSVFLIFVLPIILYLFGDISIALIQDAIKNGIDSALMRLSIIPGLAILPLFILAMSTGKDNEEMGNDFLFLSKVALIGFLILSGLACAIHYLF